MHYHLEILHKNLHKNPPQNLQLYTDMHTYKITNNWSTIKTIKSFNSETNKKVCKRHKNDFENQNINK